MKNQMDRVRMNTYSCFIQIQTTNRDPQNDFT